MSISDSVLLTFLTVPEGGIRFNYQASSFNGNMLNKYKIQMNE